MLIQYANIASGVVLILLAKKKIQLDVQKKKIIGIVESVLGILALIDRVGIHLPISNFGSSYPQAFAAIAMGFLLADVYFEKYSFGKKIISVLRPLEFWVGVAGFIVGFYSLHVFGF